MCGRFTLRTPIKAVAEVFELAADLGDWSLKTNDMRVAARFNIAPTQEIAAVRCNAASHARELVALRWGLIPPWADDPAIGNRMINARAETIATKAAFRESFRHRRCLVPADGFYEWKRGNGAKQPYYIRLEAEGPFAFAGLWERWQRAEVVIESCTIVTTESNELVRALHTRMPVIVDPSDFERWLDPAIDDPSLLKPLLHSYAADKMLAYPVSSIVNSPRHDVPQCVELTVPGKTQGSLFD